MIGANVLRISVRDTLSEALSLYLKDFKYYIGVMAFFFAYNAFSAVYLYLITPAMNIVMEDMNNIISTVGSGMISEDALMKISESAVPMMSYSLVAIAVSIVIIIFSPRMTLSTSVLANSQLEGAPEKLGAAYRATKGKYWLTVGCMLLVAICKFPAALLSNGSVSTMLISVLFTAVINALFYVLMPMIALEPITGKYLRRSVSTMRGNFWEGLILILIVSTVISVMFSMIRSVFTGNEASLLIADLVYALISALIIPIGGICATLVYRKLTPAVILKDEPPTE